ncbi:MAG TPA: dTDP-4-dehydrorhamnose 3,5-epimerase [Bacteroidia bacterium]|nr:dTDP-4-dehydrorhamnose 3,5-epimerase [Bacteroidia bacterium]
MKFTPTPLSGLILIEPDIFRDDRGTFLESYNKDQFLTAGIDVDFIQDNQSVSKLHVVRGLHFQNPPYAQGKLVRVVKGRVLDVAVDIRPGSATFGRHYSLELNSIDQKMLWIPPGFAHGFSVLEEDSVFCYKVTTLYSKEHERGIRFDDPELNINWRVPNPVVSEKDKILPTFKEYLHYVHS